MKISNKKLIQKLIELENLLIENLQDNLIFKRLYQKSNDYSVVNDDISIVNNETNIFNGIPNYVLGFVSKNSKFDNSIINTDTKLIKIKNYYELLETIYFLIDIIQLEINS